MADIITGTTSGVVDTSTLQSEHADIRREAAEHRATIQMENMKGFDRVNADVLRSANETIKESIKGDWHNSDVTKDTRHDIASRIASSTAELSQQVDAIDDTLTAQIIGLARDTQDIRAQVVSAQQQMTAGFLGAAKDSEINALKTQIETAKQTTYLSDKIGNEGDRTRALINDLKYGDLNRHLIERNSLLADAYADGRHWRDRADMSQWASVHSQLQAFGSQLQETRQGVTNFGTMSGNAGRQQSTNNVA